MIDQAACDELQATGMFQRMPLKVDEVGIPGQADRILIVPHADKMCQGRP